MSAKTMTAQELREMSKASAQRSRDSWERSDTDGFLTQWASDLHENLYNLLACIREAGDVAEFWGLYDGDRRVRARKVETRYGMCWLLDEAEAARYGRKFVPTGDTSKVQKKLGLREATEMAPAWATIGGSGTGLSGRAYVETYRTGDKWGQDAVLVEEPADDEPTTCPDCGKVLPNCKAVVDDYSGKLLCPDCAKAAEARQAKVVQA